MFGWVFGRLWVFLDLWYFLLMILGLDSLIKIMGLSDGVGRPVCLFGLLVADC
jgi:hypothetical protein